VVQLAALQSELAATRQQLGVMDAQWRQASASADGFQAEKTAMAAVLADLQVQHERLSGKTVSVEQRLRETTAAGIVLNEQLHDARVAMMELGEGNQLLQMQLAQLQGRRWTEEEDVAQCMSCYGAFSSKNRKHRCRNCGRIFCHPCSARVCATPSSKKPVRVCDGCYRELRSNMRAA
jgi:early endosome antigen 1